MNSVWLTIFIGLCLVVGIMLGYAIKENDIEMRAIEMDYGYYHPKTAEFTWKDSYLPYITGTGNTIETLH